MASASELILIFITFIIILSNTIINARELRPSDHGLEYFYEPEESSSSEMSSFFGPPSPSSTELKPSPSSSNSTLPSAVKSPMSSSKGRDHDDHLINHVLVIGSLVCGVTALAFMVASALICFLGNPKKQVSSNNPDDQIIHNDTK